MYSILSRCDEMNRVGADLVASPRGVFAPVSLEMPRFEPPELGFLRSVSWLFVLYYESGKVGVGFLVDRLDSYGLDTDGRMSRHPSVVQHLRTSLQHNLDLSKPRDSGIQAASQAWLKRQCGTAVPGSEDQWASALFGLLQEALEFMGALSAVLRKIEQDESRDAICRDWQFRIRRYHPPHEFDELIARTAVDMGRDHVDAPRLRMRFYDKWTQELSLLDGEYNFNVEARRLVEGVLLTDVTPVLPITGADIMEVFGISPGPRVGELLDWARKIYESEPCTRDVLLERLRSTDGSRS
jgi:hypothetical protein